MAGSATHLGGRRGDHRHYGVIHDALAAHEKIVDVVAQADIAHKIS
jgi:hypothetical protein